MQNGYSLVNCNFWLYPVQMCLFCAFPHSPFFPAILFNCYKALVFTIVTRHPEKHTHTPFSFLLLSSLTPVPACAHLPPLVFSRALQNVLLSIFRRCLHSDFICFLLALPAHALFWLMIIYLLLSPNKMLSVL